MSKKWIEMAHEKRGHIFPTYWYWESVQDVARAVGAEPGIYGNLYKDHEMGYITEETGFTRVGKKILKALKEDNLIEKIEKCNNEEIPKLLKVSKWFVENDLSEKSGEELLKQHNKVRTQFTKLMKYSLMGTVMEFEIPLLSNYLEEVLQDKVEDKSRLGDYFIILTTPTRQTTPQKEEIELRKLKIKELQNKLTQEDVENHTSLYSYIAFGYDGPGWSVEEVEARLRDLSDDISVLEKQIIEIQESSKGISKRQEKVIKDLNLNKKEADLFRVLSILGYWKFERKLANQKSHEMMENFIEELMRRFHLSKPQVKMIAPYEMKEILVEEKVDEHVLNERIKLSAAVFDGFKPGEIVVGERAKEIERELEKSLSVDASITEFSGACAYPGKVKGVVKRIDEEKDMDKFDDGDILISTSTAPKIIPAMKRAAAIITDSGGITCHAAIVSRELQVPCVIGTKIATRVLKDGDEVEVDAVKGLVIRTSGNSSPPMRGSRRGSFHARE